MSLKILLPYRVFSELNRVKRIVAETSEGSFGLLPKRLDCVAALVPGILEYETDTGGIAYLAVDEGILIKAGTEVWVSVRNAIDGVDLGKLRESIKREFMDLDAREKDLRSLMAKLGSSFILGLKKFQKE